MRRRLLLLFLFPLLLQAGGFYAYFAVRLMINRQEMRIRLRHLPDALLTRFELTEVAWNQAHVEEDELEIQGAMWDIARAEYHGGKWIVFALRDTQEESLWGWLEGLIQQPDDDGAGPPMQLIKLIASKFLPWQIRLPENDFTLLVSRSRYLAPCPDFIRSIQSPPPRACWLV